MSAEPPSGEDRTKLVTASCPAPACPFVAVAEFDSSNPIEAAREVRDHCNKAHEPWEVADEDISDLIGGDGQ